MEKESDITLREVAASLGRHRYLLLSCAAVTVLLGLCYAVFAKPLYTATATIRVLGQENDGGLSGLASRLGGAAALVGINLTSSTSDRDEYLAILKSRELAENFIEKRGLMPRLFPDAWNAEHGTWRQSQPSFMGRMKIALSRAVARISGDEGWKAPSAIPTESQAFETFKSMRTISEPTAAGIVELSFKFSDPKLAAEWANAYVEMANEQIRGNAVTEAKRALGYLDEELKKTTVVELRETIYGIVRSQLEKVMLANARPEYAFKIIDRAVVPESPSFPRRSIIVVLSLFLGIMVGVFAVLFKDTLAGRFALR